MFQMMPPAVIPDTTSGGRHFYPTKSICYPKYLDNHLANSVAEPRHLDIQNQIRFYVLAVLLVKSPFPRIQSLLSFLLSE